MGVAAGHQHTLLSPGVTVVSGHGFGSKSATLVWITAVACCWYIVGVEVGTGVKVTGTTI